MDGVGGAGACPLLRELSEERVAALQRISRVLESLIGQLNAYGNVYATPPGPTASARSPPGASGGARGQYRWYLEVQREALGMRRHDRLDEFYKVPTLSRSSKFKVESPGR